MSLQNVPTIEERFYAQEIGWEVLRYVKKLNVHELSQKADNEAITMIKEIKAILDDLSLDDADCFLRIDAIVRTFHKYDLPTNRHWELE